MRTNIFLRLIWFSLALAGVSLPMSAYNEETEKLLKELDEMIERPEQWEDMKSYKIIQLHKKEASVRNNEERYEINKKLFEEYSVFNADSAVSYAMRNKEIAKTEGNVEKMILWDINRSFALAVTGLLKESQDIIDSIDLSKLPVNLSPLYFNQLAYLYSHFGQYQGKDRISPSNYYEISKAYRDSTYSHAKASDELYLWYKAWASENREGENLERMKDELRQYVDSSYMTTRKDAMLAYALSNLYKISNDKENQIKYLAISAICDIRTSNKDIASLEELGKLMLEANEIDRAYSYINFCQRQARSFNNRIRSLSLSHVEKEIREYYSERDARQQRTLHAYVVLLSVLSLILIGAVFIIINRNKRLSDSRQSLSEVNDRLKDNIKELTGLREAQEAANLKLHEMNKKLKGMNQRLSDVNIKLKESNHIKEEYVGQMFYICSEYINKIEDFRKEVLRRIKAGQTGELQKEVMSPTMVQAELKEFHHYFDTIFLNIFPDFVKDFNKLFRPEDQIILKDGELLNTSLRIYALVRLGITDSVKIAALLHCSPQTVYNNRLKIRNKSIIPKEEFANRVKTLGKYQSPIDDDSEDGNM